MAKDLPYFKFFCSEWNDGDITLEDYRIQGLFINVCSYYWSNECDVTFKTLKKKFKNEIEDINYLIEEGLIKECLADNIAINFLDEQQEERKGTSKQNSIAGLKSAEARRLKKLAESNEKLTPVEITLDENPTIKRREEKKREEKNKGEIVTKFLNWFNDCKKVATGKEGKFRVLTEPDYKNLIKLKESYSTADFIKAIPNLFSSEWAKTTGNDSPSHFLRVENFNKYLNQEVIPKQKPHQW